MTWFWISIPLAVLIVALAVGIPYLLTHRHLRPHDADEGQAYLDAKDQAGEDGAVPPQRPSPADPPTPGGKPAGTGPWV